MNTGTSTIAANDMLTVTLKEALGTKTVPSTTSQTYADQSIEVEASTTLDSTTASAIGALPLSATLSVNNTVKRPGAVSGYRIMFRTQHDLVANEDVITVHFDKDFKGHGSNLSRNHVTVSASAPDPTGAVGPTNSAIVGGNDVLRTGAFNPDSDASLDRLTSAKHHLSNKDALNNIEYQILVPDMNGTSDGRARH